MTGKSAKFRALKTLSNLPAFYKNQKNTLMKNTIFKDWFFNNFVTQVGKFLKKKLFYKWTTALLFLKPNKWCLVKLGQCFVFQIKLDISAQLFSSDV